MSKLKNFAHPRSWIKGEAVSPLGERGVVRDRDLAVEVKDVEARIPYLQFASTENRDQWLKWWRKV